MHLFGKANKKIKPSSYLLPVLLLLLLITLIYAFIQVCSSPYLTQNITDISEQWQYYTEHDPTPKPIKLPSGTEGIYLHENCYLSHSLSDRGNNAALMFRSDYLQVIAQLDGEEIYRYGYEKTSFSSPGKKLVLIPLPNDYVGKEITLTLTPTMNLRLNSIYMGDEESLISFAVGKSIPLFAAGIFLCLLGLTLFCIYFIRRNNEQAVTADFWFGVFVILVGLFLPGKTLLPLILFEPMQATLVLMMVNYLLPCSVLLFTYTSCSKFRVPILIALILHLVGYLPLSLMQVFMPAPPTRLLAIFVYLVPLYYALSVGAFIREIHANDTALQRLKYAGFILIFMVLADKANSKLGNPMHFSDVETFSKFGLVLFITIEVVGRINDYFRENARLLADFQASEVKNRLALEHFEDIQEYIKEASILNHDINHHFNALELLLEQGDLPRAREYLSQICTSYPLKKQIVFSKNQLLNHIMGYAIKEAEQKNISFKHDIDLPENIKINDSDFYSLFINIIDNAIEACAAIEDNSPKDIELVCNIKNEFMHVSCMNSKNNDIIMEDGRYISTKSSATKSDTRRGLGMGIIEEIVEKYHGVLDIEYDRNRFIIKLVIKVR